MSDSPEERRPKRSKRETSYKAKAFEKFKQLKSGNRNKYEIEELENVYETVAENEYVKEVLSRQDDDWIVDDDGSGYIEDGRDIFDDDLDSESIALATKKGKGTKRKKKAVSENAGKGNLQFMLSNMPTKKKEDTKIDDDAMLSEILEEIDESPSQSILKPKPFTNTYSIMSRKLAAKNYMKNFSPPIKPVAPKPLLNKLSANSDSKSLKSVLKEMPQPIEHISSLKRVKSPETIEMNESEANANKNTEEISSQAPENFVIENDYTQDCFDDDLDLTQIEEFESQNLPNTSTVDETTITDELQAEFMSEWENIANETNEVEIDNLDKSNIPLVEVEDKKVFRFFWWDAYEDPEKQKGVVFLFGKTYCDRTKSYVSCCVAIRNIDRRLFFLPRPYALNDSGQPTDEPVTLKMVYNEVNETIAKPLQITSFRTRNISKKYAFNPEIPTESDYMEVRYPATDPKIDINNLRKKPRTFSKIFGTNSSFLEILLLDRKIKGPCWLDISNPVAVSNPISWCKFEVSCMKITDVNITSTEKPLPPPPLVVMAINLRSFINPKTYSNEILLISCLAHTKYAVDKRPPNPPFQQHFCVFSCPTQQMLPLNIHEALKFYKATKVQKMDTERALLNYFITQFSKIDPDLIVGHDLQGYQINILSERLSKQDNKNFSKLGRLKRSERKKLEKTLFVGRLVCDIKISAKELIKSRSYDLDTLCQVVLKIKENQRIELEPEEIPKMYQTADGIMKLISFTMQDAAFILRIMYDLNAIPLALQITNIAGNVMSRTLMGGRSERNEFLLLHAFSEKGFIVPDKEFKKRETTDRTAAARKKPTYSGGLVLEPKAGFYDKLILLMDFNSLYPSIIQEYNICFTTLPVSNNEENLVLPDRSLPPGILPTEIRKLVESRRQVKGLMNSPDISNDLRMQYNIRQMALKLTANSMYGCLGFSNSRFYAKNLAALVTHKGREILTNTRDLVQKMCYEVVYGDTDSIMINTNILDYDQVFKIGVKIKQEVNKLYKQVELDIDGVFKYLLLLKKKKYAAVTLVKTKDGKLKAEKEYKGLDIVRRDWSQLACEVGKYILEHILSDQSSDDRINNIHTYLAKVKEDLEQNRVPLPLLVITKQLTKDPKMYADKNSLPHVQVALRYNQRSGGHLRAGDTVPYVICDDATSNAATQRGYHIEELKNSETLKIDVQYYLAHQIHPVVTRICEPIEGTDSFRIAECLGLDTSSFKRPKQATDSEGANFTKPEVKFRNVDEFRYKCFVCKQENVVANGNVQFLEKCNNSECNARPVDYLPYIQNQLVLLIQSCVMKYYGNVMICEDPGCPNETTRLPIRFAKKYPVCTMCQKGVMYRVYTEQQLYTQLSYYQHMFDLNKLHKKPLMEQQIESGYHALRETVEKYLNHSAYSVISLTELFSGFMMRNKHPELIENDMDSPREGMEEDEDEDF